MDQRVVEEKIESLRRCVRRVESKRPDQLELLVTDWDLQDILTLNLTRAVQLSVDIAMYLIASTDRPVPETMGETFDHLREMDVLSRDLPERMKSAVGFRNIAIHNYRKLDWEIVHKISHDHLDDFRQFAVAVLDYLGNELRP